MNTAKVSIGCKIGCDQFPYEPWGEGNEASGDEIVSFLLSDCNYAWDPEKDVPLKGDKNIWYLCCCEKFGALSVEDFSVSWSFGEATPEKVLEFITELHKREVINGDQFLDLRQEVLFARDNFEIHYDISDYLIAIRDGKEWKKPNNGAMMHSKSLTANVIQGLAKVTGVTKIHVPNVGDVDV